MFAAWICAGLLAATPAVPRLVINAAVIQDASVYGELDAAQVDAIARKLLAFALDVEPLSQEEQKIALVELRRCAQDLGCLRQSLRQQGLEWALEILANLRVEPKLITVQLISASRGEQTAVAEVGAQGPRVEEVIERTLSKMMSAAGQRVGGRAVLAVAPPDAQIQIDPPPPRIFEGGRSFVGPAGTYRLAVSRDGFLSQASELVLREQQETSLELRLEEEPSFLASPWLWIGVGVAAAAAGAITAVALYEPELRLCQARDPASCN